MYSSNISESQGWLRCPLSNVDNISSQWSYDNFYASQDYTVVGDSTQRIAFWLQHTSVFKEIWVHGSKGVLNWWWLQNLCIFTAGAWTILLATEG